MKLSSVEESIRYAVKEGIAVRTNLIINFIKLAT